MKPGPVRGLMKARPLHEGWLMKVALIPFHHSVSSGVLRPPIAAKTGGCVAEIGCRLLLHFGRDRRPIDGMEGLNDGSSATHMGHQPPAWVLSHLHD